MPTIVWSREDTRRAAAMRQAGIPIIEIAAFIGKTPQQVQAKMSRLGVTLTNEQRREINLRVAELGTSEITGRRQVSQALCVRSATLRLEVAYCEAAERNGWSILGYEAGA